MHRDRNRRLWRLWLSGLVIGMMLLPGTALAGDDKTGETETATEETEVEKPEFVKPTPVSEVTFVVPGVDVTVEVVLDDTGHLAEVNLEPDADPEVEKKHAVSFLLEDGETEVRVWAAFGAVQTKVKTNDLANILGPGVWSADLFGTGETSTVNYTVDVDADGSPTITIDSIVNAGGVESTEIDLKSWSSEDGTKAFAMAGVTFTYERMRKTLFLKVMSFEKDGEVRVSLSATVSGGHRFRHWKGWFGCRDAEWKGWFGKEYEPGDRFDRSDFKDAGWFGSNDVFKREGDRDGDRDRTSRDGRRGGFSRGAGH